MWFILDLNSSNNFCLLSFPEIIETQYLLVTRYNLSKILSVLTDGPFKTNYMKLVYLVFFSWRDSILLNHHSSYLHIVFHLFHDHIN